MSYASLTPIEGKIDYPVGILLRDGTIGFIDKKDLMKEEISDLKLEEVAETKKIKFLKFAGIWKDVDVEKIKEEIREMRRKSARKIKEI